MNRVKFFAEEKPQSQNKQNSNRVRKEKKEKNLQ